MNEPIAAVLVGLLFSLSAGVRLTLPLLALSLLAFYQTVALPASFHWLGTRETVLIFSVAAVVETLIHFIPAVGTWIKASATPLAFAAGTLLMAVPLAHANPLYQWTLAAGLGGGAAVLTHLGVTGVRAITGPANLATGGLLGLAWNLGEIVLSLLFSFIGGLCIFLGWVIGLILLAVLLGTLFVLALQAWRTRPFMRAAQGGRVPG